MRLCAAWSADFPPGGADTTITELTRAVNRLAASIESLKEGEKEKSPCTPLKEKGKKHTHISRARGVVFTTPTLDECRAYAAKMRLAMDVSHFHDHYTSNGWKISGRAPMKDWRAAMRNWARREKAVRPLTAYERKRAEFELQAEVQAVRKEQARASVIAARRTRPLLAQTLYHFPRSRADAMSEKRKNLSSVNWRGVRLARGASATTPPILQPQRTQSCTAAPSAA